ncbi:apolipoprotein N-acyltransferase [Candidatus Venteria ishoeyi]|uniref:Apolipoprotein N-acyltransferase n=1 Tax=Candidatus Venteria ishoeyi TaxID=1899563 RepID=A0A1H6FB30_9GAMM|nr:apolipoprotein N-acyltransferase [Candidatus Venteria ishoeyi]MDM8545397.1 apolipoprotein N-acyltransferase [Candidatus Venteria ishoeyi]SEH07288.1 Apolipoprotein N-acyltransferase [Candidatus Venteria ishoeyi]
MTQDNPLLSPPERVMCFKQLSLFLERYPWLGDLGALLAGGLLVLAFAPFGLFPVAILSLLMLFLLWKACSPARAFWRGWLFGLGQFGFGVNWLHISLAQFGGIDLAAAIALNAAFVMLMALYPALLGLFILKVYPVCNKVRLLVALPAAWTVMEWVRGSLFGGFPWLLVGTSQVDSPLAGWAPMMGVYALSWAVAFSACLILYSVMVRHRAWKPLLGFILLWGFGALLTLVNWGNPEGKPLNVALVQGNTPQEIKFMHQYAEPIIKNYLELSRQHRDADLIIWPETAIPLFFHQAMPFIQEIIQEHKDHKTDFLIGMPMQDPDDNQIYNAVAMINAEKPGFYYKRHLVPFGEYMPLRSLIEESLDFIQIPFSDFSEGPKKQSLLSTQRHYIGISICYEDAFPAEIRRALPGANFLVNVSNDAWFGDSLAPHQHLQIARMRALEAGRPLLRATNTGITAIIDAHGKVVTQMPQFQQGVIRARIQPRSGATPYALEGNIPLLFIMIVFLGIGIILHYFWHPVHSTPC